VMPYLAYALEILILAVGIHLFLRFVRTTRGNRLIRGLFLSVTVGVVGLWGLSRALGLEELEHLLQGSTGFIVIGFVVIFQSELRRGIAQLGEHTLLGGLMPAADGHVVEAVLKAARSLSEVRRGALIVFERETSLHTVIETGTPIDADVHASLLESLFHPETPLHDGAVVVRGDRITAAGCILPLSESMLPAHLGTRHRAAVGISEETDAVVLVVSEESGSISLVRSGRLESNLEGEKLLSECLRLVEGRTTRSSSRSGLLRALLKTLRGDLVWLPGSLALAVGVFYIAHQSLQDVQEYRVHFVDASARDAGPRAEEVVVLLDSKDDRLVESGRDFVVEVTGTRRTMEELGGALRGVLRIEEPDWEGGAVDIARIHWEDDGGLRYSWKGGTVPELVVRRFETRSIRLTPEALEIDESQRNPRLRLAREELRFEPGPTVEVHGPRAELDRLARGGLKLRPIAVPGEEHGELRRRIELHPDLRGRDLALESEVAVVVPLRPVAREIGTLTREIALVCLDPARTDELARWSLPPHLHSARFSITTEGLIPEDADPSSPAMIERFAALRRFVEENLWVFVDVGELPPQGEGRSARVRWTWRRRWNDTSNNGEDGTSPGSVDASLDVVLQSDAEVLLEARATPIPAGARNPTQE
jgi:diadenylate cyclase